jgi:hypothetical protein
MCNKQTCTYTHVERKNEICGCVYKARGFVGCREYVCDGVMQSNLMCLIRKKKSVMVVRNEMKPLFIML